MKALREGKEGVVYDGKRIVAIIDGFGELLATHLEEEVTFLEGMEKFGDKIDWESVGKRVQKHAVSTANTVCIGFSPSTYLPFLFSSFMFHSGLSTFLTFFGVAKLTIHCV